MLKFGSPSITLSLLVQLRLDALYTDDAKKGYLEYFDTNV